ncbi:hypothetical protein SERLA73DRAFT_162920, partial [Serpula lacrymans var. lacrymans S7.3]
RYVDIIANQWHQSRKHDVPGLSVRVASRATGKSFEECSTEICGPGTRIRCPVAAGKAAKTEYEVQSTFDDSLYTNWKHGEARK